MGRRVFALLAAALFFYVAYPLFIPVAMGGILAVLLFPILERLKVHRVSTPIASSLVTLAFTLVILIPTALLIFLVAKAGLQELQVWKEAPRGDESWFVAFVNSPRIHRVMTWITESFPVSMDDLAQSAQDLIRSVGLKITELLGELFAQIPRLIISLAVTVVSLFFFLLDGPHLVVFLRRHTIFDDAQTDQLISTFAGICRFVILAAVVSGVVQALVETAVCLATGVPQAALIGALVLLASFVPVVGSAPVTFGVAAHQLLVGRTAVGISLVISALVIIMLDNLIRPLFLRGSANLHPLVAFVAAFGGLQTLGPAGVFLGPVIAAVFLATVQILAP